MARAESTIRVQFDPADRRLIERIAKSLDTLTRSEQLSPAEPPEKNRTEHMSNAIVMVSEVAKAHGIPYELVADIVNDLQSKGVIFVYRSDSK